MNKTSNESFQNGTIFCNYIRDHIPKEGTNTTHSHPYFELLAIRQGDIIYTARGEMRRLGERCIIYNPSSMIHNQFVQEHRLYERYKVCFYKEDLLASIQNPTLLAQILDTPMLKELEDEDFDMIYALCKDIYDLNRNGSEDELSYIRARTNLLLALMRSFSATDRHETHEQTYITDVVKYINLHLSESLRLETIAAEFFVSKSKLTYDFKAYCNMSIHEYITIERIEKSKKLLESGYRISAVAEELGFSSASYFIKVFTSVTGITPLQWQFKKTNTLI